MQVQFRMLSPATSIGMGSPGLSVSLIVCLGSFAIAQANTPKCFQFRWSSPSNCTDLKGVPCIEPLIVKEGAFPNLTKIWQEKENTDKLCEMTAGKVCIKYTFMYNNAIINSSYYCGKATEDKTTAVTDGCYYQHVDGYTIHVCACQSRQDAMPCNKAGRVEFLWTVAIMFSLIALFNFVI